MKNFNDRFGSLQSLIAHMKYKNLEIMRPARTLLVIACFIVAKPGFTQDATGVYKVRLDQPQQIIRGLGVEIQNDAIGSGNTGLPDETIAIPANLLPAERTRMYNDLLKGFRYCRLAMGLYLRGLDSSRSRIVERYPGQMNDLKELITRSGMEGISMEYWSPAPFWKSTNSYLGGTLRDSSDAFLNAFGEALCDDIRYLQQKGIPITMWGLQNEGPLKGVGNLTLGAAAQSYSHCYYPASLYVKTFRKVAPMIRPLIPDALITADTWDGNSGETGKLLQQDTTALKYIDAWVYHRVGVNSNKIRQESPLYTSNTFGKPVYQNEFEYQHPVNDSICINTAQNIINWFVFANSPTWFWLHALKPTSNAEAAGYCLGFWRPHNDDNFKHNSHIKKGHWDYNQQNFNALAGFLKHMPWNSRRFTVEEDSIRNDQRILAFKTPENKLVLVFTNRSRQPFTFRVNTMLKGKYKGYRYTPSIRNKALKPQSIQDIKATLPPFSIEFWVQD